MLSGGHVIVRNDGARFRAAILTALHRSAPLAALLSGVAGVLHDAGAAHARAPGTAVHAMFGMALLAAVIEQFGWRMRHGPPMLACDVAAMSRSMSLRVYLLLYVLVGARQMFIILSGAGQTGAVDGAHAGDLRSYLLCGVIALVTIRVLAAALPGLAARYGGRA
jgi:cytochrome b561